MSQTQFSKSKPLDQTETLPYGWITFGIISIFVVIAGAMAFASPTTLPLRNSVRWLFALDSAQYTWYLTRSAGIMAYLLLWFSTAWGLAIPSKIIDRLLHRSFTFDFHQVVSLFALGFLGLHIFILTADQYLPYSLAQIFVPFISPYRPFWVGLGVLALYILVLVTATFYLRQIISMKTFRYIHYTSLIGYLGATLHGIFSGTDSSLPAAMLMYLGTFLVIVFLTGYWLFILWTSNRPQTAPRASRQTSRN